MAIDLPATRLALDPGQFRRSKPILSGDGAIAAVKARGLRGVVSETNHVYAYRGRTLWSDSDWDDGGLISTALVAGAACTDLSRRTVAADIALVRLTCEVLDGSAQLYLDGVGAGWTANAVGRTIHTQTIAATPGLQRAQIYLRADPAGAGTAVLYWYRISEAPMTAGVFP